MRQARLRGSVKKRYRVRSGRRLVMAALTMALAHRRVQPGLLHHSDRGSQYTSEAFQRLLADHGIRCSMGGQGNCYDCERASRASS